MTPLTTLRFLGLAALGVALAGCGSTGTDTSTSSTSQGGTMLTFPCNASGAGAQRSYSAPPPMSIDTSRRYRVTLGTVRGPIVLEVDPGLAPNTANNFLYLACHGFFTGLTFHRVENWVVQGGDPQGNGMGGPGYKFADEPVKTPYVTGVLAMANSGPNTNGSQFFILKQDTPLPPSYTIFGRVTDGMPAVNQLQIGDHMDTVLVEVES
ncbi:MAG: peptidylprolyl isomerase [Candidatus Dormibacteria bacterium]